MPRIDKRRPNQIRPVRIQRGFTSAAPGSVLIKTGNTHVLCTATIEESVPRWRQESELGWVTAEYEMLPGSTGQRRSRNRGGRVDGRTQEIQRLIGRSLRAVVDMKKLGQRTIWLDCDVIQADGGTRTASINGAYIALADAVRSLMRKKVLKENPIKDSIAAISVGLIDGTIMLDLCYEEDVRAEVDSTVVMTGKGQFVEVQGTAEAGTFSRAQMTKMLTMADKGLQEIKKLQDKTLNGRARRTK